jgi:hypothetical protein
MLKYLLASDRVFAALPHVTAAEHLRKHHRESAVWSLVGRT